MDTRIQIVAVLASGVLLIGVLELVRRRRMLERYALLWLFSAAVVLLLGAWTGLLQDIADVAGIAYPPSALFGVAFLFVLVLLLHFSVAVSKLTDQTKVLAQRLALLEQELRDNKPRVRRHVAGEPHEREPQPAEHEPEPEPISGAGRS
jgi:hypothetical protein